MLLKNLMTKRVGAVAILTVTTATLVPILVLSVYSQTAEELAFTANLVERNYRATNRQDAVIREYRHAVRSDGSEADLYDVTAPNGRTIAMKIVTDLGQLRRVAADGLTESITTTYLTKEYAQSRKAKPRDCGADPQAERRTYLGYETLRIARNLSSPRPRTVEQWVAPTLNCFPLKETYLQSAEGENPIVLTEREVSSVTPGEPDPTLFDIPGSYKERAPTAVFTEFAKRYPNYPAACDEPCRRSRSRVDQAYYAQQPRGVQ